MYQLLGDGAERHFATDWATGVAIENAAQWRSVLQSALQNVVVLILLERMGAAPGRAWLARARAAAVASWDVRGIDA